MHVNKTSSECSQCQGHIPRQGGGCVGGAGGAPHAVKWAFDIEDYCFISVTWKD